MKDKSSSVAKSIAILTIVIIIIALFIIFIAGAGTPKKSSNQLEDIIKAEFSLTDQNNKEFTSNDLKGKISLIYFGFTHCPDICPFALNKLVEIISALEKKNISINSVFVTVDPRRDSTQLLKDFLNNFHHSIIGLRGTEDQISKVVTDFKTSYQKVPNSDNPDNYTVNHPSLIYIFDKNVKCIKYFSIQDDPKLIGEYILKISNNSINH